MVNSIITEAYKFYSDNKNPRRYEEFEIPLIDKALSRLKIDAKNRSWWWVTDELFKKSEIRWSKLAQTKAMPVLEDLSKIANSNESISTTYSKPIVKDTGETLLEYFNRTLTEVIRDFPILNNSTLLDMSSSRVISLDLNDVAPEGSDTAEKQSNVFYMLGRFAVTRNFFLADDTYKYAPSIYKKYLLSKITEHRVTPKRFCVDELHRTSNLPSFRNQIKRDMREGRKILMMI
jgi:intracellular multiplication protein IcmB